MKLVIWLTIIIIIPGGSALSNQGESRDVNLAATKSNIMYVDTLALVTKLEKAGNYTIITFPISM